MHFCNGYGLARWAIRSICSGCSTTCVAPASSIPRARRGPDTNVPESIATAITAQVGRLSASAQRMLGLASVFGAAFQVADLQFAQEHTTTRQVVDDLEEAERMGSSSTTAISFDSPTR